MMIKVCSAKYRTVIEAAIKRAIRDLPKTPEFGVDEWRTGDLVILVSEIPADAAIALTGAVERTVESTVS